MKNLQDLYDGKINRIELEESADIIDEVTECLSENIVGQVEAKKAIGQCIKSAMSPLNNKEGPLGVMYFYGSTGSGKTELAKELSKYVFGFKGGVTHISCEQLQHSHEGSKVFGAPPGYVGYNDKPQLHPKKLYDSYNTAVRLKSFNPRMKRFTNMSVVIFDEIEKANPVFHQSLLRLIDEGVVILGDGTEVNLSNSFVVFTSNIGEKESQRPKIGFGDKTEEKKDTKLTEIKKHFSPEFVGRVDNFIHFEELTDEDKVNIIKNRERDLLYDMGIICQNVLVKIDPSVYDYILNKHDPKKGVRSMRRIWDVEIKDKAGNLVVDNNLDESGYNIILDCVEEDLKIKFYINKDGIIKNVQQQLLKNIGTKDKNDPDGWGGTYRIGDVVDLPEIDDDPDLFIGS